MANLAGQSVTPGQLAGIGADLSATGIDMVGCNRLYMFSIPTYFCHLSVGIMEDWWHICATVDLVIILCSWFLFDTVIDLTCVCEPLI